jgi:hypothetical protein
MGKLILTSSISRLVEQKGGIKKDDEGYYYVRLGTIGTENSMGIKYEFTQELNNLLLNESSPFLMRIKQGYLRAEYGHPQQKPGQDTRAYFARLSRLEPTLQCGHFKQIEVIEGKEGSNTVTIYAWFKPSGPYGKFVEEELNNPNVNSAFSIRTIAEQFVKNGKLVRHIKLLITWDYVTTPGIATANKIGAMEESIDYFSLDLSDTQEVSRVKEDLESFLSEGDSAGLEADEELIGEALGIINKCTDKHCLMKYWN